MYRGDLRRLVDIDKLRKEAEIVVNGRTQWCPFSELSVKGKTVEARHVRTSKGRKTSERHHRAKQPAGELALAAT
jgi:hypothetical protein